LRSFGRSNFYAVTLQLPCLAFFILLYLLEVRKKAFASPALPLESLYNTTRRIKTPIMSADLADAIVQAAERMKTQEDRSSYGALYYEKRVQTGFITGAPVREYCFRGANGRVYQEFR
jgi:hypothetical protein